MNYLEYFWKVVLTITLIVNSIILIKLLIFFIKGDYKK